MLGAGVTGAMLAVRLAEAGIETAVIDCRGVARGSTPASTALIQYEIDTPLIELAQLHGQAVAELAYRQSAAALDQLRHLVDRHAIACDLAAATSLFVATSESDLQWFPQELAARQRIGLDVELLDRAQLASRFKIDRPAAIWSARAMQLDPYKLTHGLLAAAQRRGVKIFDAEVLPRECGQPGHVLTTQEGVSVRCRHLIIATGYETPDLFAPIRSHCALKTTFALASQADDNTKWPESPLIWESARPYFYARTTADGHVIVGGEDEDLIDPTRRDRMIEQKTAVLVKKFNAMFPHIAIDPEFAWAGVFAETADGLPLIGSPAEWPGCYFALGYGGNGITFSVIAAEIIVDAIQGRKHPAAGVFGFDRLRER